MLAIGSAFSQNDNNTIERKGFIFGVGIGGGVISMADSNDEVPFEEAQFGISLPNLKLGWMVNDQKLHMGRVYLDNDEHRDGVAFSIGLGFNWY
ncbi:MAG: hypothetical protein R2828_32790 [Saprospiraceae bacterium]